MSFYLIAAAPSFGIPVGIGYQGNNVGGIVSYDLLPKRVSVSGGYADANKKDNPPPPAPILPPA